MGIPRKGAADVATLFCPNIIRGPARQIKNSRIKNECILFNLIAHLI
jgi:hypothetical protein